MANGASPPRAPPRHCLGQGRLIVRQRDEALLNFKTLLKEKVGSAAPRVRSAVRAYGHRSAAQQQAERPSSIARSAAAELSERAGGGGPQGAHCGHICAGLTRSAVAWQVQSGAVEWADVRHRRALKSPPYRAVAVLLQTAWCVVRGAVSRAAARCGVPYVACGGVAAC